MTDIESKTKRIDGRTARAQRTRSSVIDAVLELVNAGDPRPTAPKIAETAGVSLRSVFQHFSDLDSLYTEAAGREWEALSPYLAPVDAGMGLVARIDAFVVQRIEIFERLQPIRTSSRLFEPFNDTMRAIIKNAGVTHRIDTARVFARELAGDLIRTDIAAAATSYEAWEVYSRYYDLDNGAVKARMTAALAGVLSV